MTVQFLEDLRVGQTFHSGRIVIDAEGIRQFAAQFDPQSFHLDEQAARNTIFHGLVASGWHTTAITMRLLSVSDFKPAGGIVGAGVDELRWPCPVRPGDELHVDAEILAVRPSKSRPQQGIVRVRVTTLNQRDEPVQSYLATLVVLRRPAG